MGHWVLMKVDLSNAFNCIDRQTVLHETQTCCPALYTFIRYCYQLNAPLFCGGQVLSSQTGVHQGCPLGPTGFALGIHSLIERLETVGLTWQSWYLDDGVLIGDALSVSAAYLQIQTEMTRIGLAVNARKCEIWGPGTS
jgi:hypothetical protein